MIVTGNSFVAYQLIPGTFAIQATLFICGLYIVLTQDIENDKFMIAYWTKLAHDNGVDPTTFVAKVQDEFETRSLTILFIHMILMLQAFLIDYIKIESLTSVSMATGMLLVLMLILEVNSLLLLFPLHMY